MDQISELGFFVVLVRNMSLAATARELNITPSAVTKRLSKLEQRLGVRLLNRTTRNITLTDEGTTYLEHAERIIGYLAEAESQVSSRSTSPKGLLRVNAPLGFGRSYIAPLLSEFSRLYPDIDLQLELTDRPINLAGSAFDIQIRFGDIPDSQLIARHIASNRRLLCATPDYLKNMGIPEQPADLTRHSCIVLKQNDASNRHWKLRKQDKIHSIRIKPRFTTNDGSVALKWALDGHGILMRAEWEIANHLREGHLQQVLPSYETPPADIYAVYLQKSNRSAKLAAFIKHLEESFLTSKISLSHDSSIW